jgi:hypothetical protein
MTTDPFLRAHRANLINAQQFSQQGRLPSDTAPYLQTLLSRGVIPETMTMEQVRQAETQASRLPLLG